MDKDIIKQKLKAAFADFKTAIQLHPDINKKRADGGWSVGEIADHIIKGTTVDLGTTKRRGRPFDQHAAAIRDLFLNFQVKFPAMAILQPDTKHYQSDELFSLLDRNLNNILTMIQTDDLTETCVDIRLPVWGALTKYEWLILFENHLIRHTKQVTDFK